MQFDLSRLTLADYRAMRDHYQINSSMAVLSFMVHQAEWRIGCNRKSIANELDDMIRPVWSRLIRAISQAYWAGFAPTIIEWENDLQSKRVVPARFKDLIPENSQVNWKQVPGWAPNGTPAPNVNIYDGIKRVGLSFPVPADNTLWYPLLLENGDYYGRKLLRSAFPSWFFSTMIHLFANRYFERFGEPVPIGRADYEQTVTMGGEKVNGRVAMERILTQIRNRSVVVLPSDRNPIGDGSKSEYAFDISYLESQMRGADFERYLDRLDEEMSLSMFTPVLLLRTADVGSYNLGVGHMQMYMWMLNAILADLADYLNPYLVERAKAINWGPNAPTARLEFKPMGKQDSETIRSILASLIGKGSIRPDIAELGQAAGLTLTEINDVTEPPSDPTKEQAPLGNTINPKGTESTKRVIGEAKARIRSQVEAAFREGRFGQGQTIRLGYRRAVTDALVDDGANRATADVLTNTLYQSVNNWMSAAFPLGRSAFADADAFMAGFSAVVDAKVEELAD